MLLLLGRNCGDTPVGRTLATLCLTSGAMSTTSYAYALFTRQFELKSGAIA
ncbi:hypothetical protein H6G96_13890 [Nostoc sp. FACHB-892]|uniref:hypothetical protein n=1 Tax=Nostoc sp. FACHB-892 TaxID=2692843 RepID=UPI001682F3E4|nr:hypothetical protein [Nostoc sp. FACHB-892]MBD2727392.1 hypothetical protein [Nostoc sp. FACHB-892]